MAEKIKKGGCNANSGKQNNYIYEKDDESTFSSL